MIGLVWFLIVAFGGAFLMEYFIEIYPQIGGALLPLAFVLMLTVLVVGRMLISKVLKNAIK
jgi:hypothetical protein